MQKKKFFFPMIILTLMMAGILSNQVFLTAQAKDSSHISTTDSTTEKQPALLFPAAGITTEQYNLKTGHYAIDIANRRGTPIWAAAAGTVTLVQTGCGPSSLGCGAGYGNYVAIDHGNDVVTLYGHLEQVNVKIGDKVTQGQVIGTMGSSGNVMKHKDIYHGVHLHFEVQLNGIKVDPMPYFHD